MCSIGGLIPSRPDGLRVYSSSGIDYYLPRNWYAFRETVCRIHRLKRRASKTGVAEPDRK
ncbi:hypothetical protein WN55_05746 [Dufourea novaeangliae]|uniref:Uncharacterized protein n=1 Tax=Dufourea novaeangliae TaxID=178035 RepID=A0A154PPQ0_DUFNO|nr:hypothetical protein WN55_05746 [Dufourea novaeangliae]